MWLSCTEIEQLAGRLRGVGQRNSFWGRLGRGVWGFRWEAFRGLCRSWQGSADSIHSLVSDSEQGVMNRVILTEAAQALPLSP